ncbi:MAG: tRNA uridine-5-carboxymethylaminomethyl(34) synthesis enzyme MnmG, partial [Myxococcota bacterium]
EDNADKRLTPLGREIGLVDPVRWQRFQSKMEEEERLGLRLEGTLLRPNAEGDTWAKQIGISPMRNPISLCKLLGRADVAPESLLTLPLGLEQDDVEALQQIAIQQRYAGYLNKQEQEAKLFREGETVCIPQDMDFHTLVSLSYEVRELLQKTRPHSIGQASRIPGMTPAALQILTVYLHAHNKQSREVA